MNIWPFTTRDLQTSYFCLWSKLNLLHHYFWFGAAIHVLLWLNTVAAVQMLFIKRIFCFLHDIILKEDRNNIKVACRVRVKKKSIKLIFLWKKMTPKIMVLQSWKKLQVLKKDCFFKKSPSRLFVQIRPKKQCAEVF